MAAARPRRVHYAWFVAAVTFLVLLTAAGVRATPSVLIVPLEREFGWSRTVIASAISVNLVLYGLIGPFAAAVMQSFGIRRTVTAALGLIAVGVALTSFMTRSWHLVLLWGVLVGIGTGTGAMVLGATVVQRWFVKDKGLVLGLLTAASATGQLVFLPLFAWIVEHHGWRTVSLVVAATITVVAPVVAFVMRDRPGDVGELPYGADADHVVPPPPRGNPLANALGALGRATKHGDFWLLAGSFFVCGATTQGLVGTHLIPACMDHGIPEVRAAGLLALMGIFDLVGTTTSGWLTDRYDSRKLLFWYYGLRGLSLLYLPYAFDMSLFGLPVFAVFYGLDWIATVPPTVRLTTQTMGPADGPIVYGWIVTAHQLGAAAGALGAAVVRTSALTYTPAWFVAGGLCVGAAFLVLRIGRPGPALDAAIADLER